MSYYIQSNQPFDLLLQMYQFTQKNGSYQHKCHEMNCIWKGLQTSKLVNNE